MDGEAPRRAMSGRVLRAAWLLLASQLAFWTLLAWGERSVRLPAEPPASIQVKLSNSDGRFDPAAPWLTANYLPWPVYLFEPVPEPIKARFRLEFTAEPGRAMGLLLPVRPLAYEIRLNDRLLQALAPNKTWGRGVVGTYDADIYPLPAEYLREGLNEITIDMGGRTRRLLPHVQIGEWREVLHAWSWSRAMGVELPMAGIAVMLFAALLTLTVRWREARRQELAALVALLVVWSFYSLAIVAALRRSLPLPVPFATLDDWGIAYSLPIAFLAHVLAQCGASTRQLLGVSALWPLSLGVVVVALWIGHRQTLSWLQALPSSIESVFVISATLGSAAILLGSQLRASPHAPRPGETMLLLMCATAIAADVFDDRYALHIPFVPSLPLTFAATPACGVLIGLGSLLVLAAQARAARQEIASANQTLRRTLSQREAELAAGHEREKELLQHRIAQEERQRMVRDMHDGIGGQLASLIHQVRNRSVEWDALDRGLSASLGDLRLIVDSSDHAGDSLDLALANFRLRAEPQIAAAGMKLAWEHRLDEPVEGLAAAAILQIFRVLQEATTNAMRHSQATQIVVRVERIERDSRRAIRIAIIDDGRGVDPAARPGRGLQNMRQRAAAIGAQLEVHSDTRGTSVELLLPEPERRPG